MPLVGQMTIENPARHWVQQAEMVENDPGRSDIPAVLSGQWWGLAGGRDATIMVTNASAGMVTADVLLAFGGEQHKLQPLVFNSNETKQLSVAGMLAGLSVGVAQAPEGRITVIQQGSTPSLVSQGRVTDPVTGFSTTLEFPDPARQHASALHASGIPVGTPTADSPFAGDGTFTPHVIASNLSSKPQTLTITLEYPKAAGWNSANGPGGAAAPRVRFVGVVKKGEKDPNDALDHPPNPDPSPMTGRYVLAPLAIGPDSTVDFSLASVMSQLSLPVPYASVRIQYSGAPGSIIAQVASVDESQDLVVDARTANELDGWAGSGANPWHVDSQTDSILFLTDEGDKPARIGFSITAGGTHYYLTSLQLAPGETRAINIRQLRDAQAADFQGNKIPANATDGSVNWVRFDSVAVEGRPIVIQRQLGMASNYDCSTCYCPAVFTALAVAPGSFGLIPLAYETMGSTATYHSCNTGNFYYDVTAASSWTSNNTPVIQMDATVHYRADAKSGGTATVSGGYTDCFQFDTNPDLDCPCITYHTYTASGGGTVVTVKIQTQSNSNNYVFVGADSSVVPYNTQFAVGIPDGGSYAWSVSPESVSIAPNNSTNSYLVAFSGITPSGSIGSTTEKVIYTYASESNSDTRAITLRKFSALATPTTESGCPDFQGAPPPGLGYLEELKYGILTIPGSQVVQPGFSGITVAEVVTLNSVSPQGTQVNLNTGQPVPTSSASQATDCLSIPSSTALPSNLVVCATQTLSVGGVLVRTNKLKYTNTSVSIVTTCP